jgi:hypothetical protein
MAKRKFNKKAFKNWLDALCRLVVKERDEWQCQRCLLEVEGRNCQWAHVISRTANKTRWDLMNSMVLCASCHARFHSDPVAFGIWFEDEFPAREKALAVVRRLGNKTWKQEHFEEIERRLLRKCKDLNVDPYKIEKRYQKKLIARLK